MARTSRGDGRVRPTLAVSHFAAALAQSRAIRSARGIVANGYETALPVVPMLDAATSSCRCRRRFTIPLALLALALCVHWLVPRRGEEADGFQGWVRPRSTVPRWLQSLNRRMANNGGRPLFGESNANFSSPYHNDSNLSGLNQVRNLAELVISDTQVTDDGLVHLAGCDDLMTVSLLNSRRITDRGLQHLLELPDLTELSLAGTPITDAGLKTLAALTQLQSLSLAGTQVTDAGLPHLHGLAALSRLSLQDTAISDSGLQHLSRLRALQSLNLENTDITDAGLKQLTPLVQLRKLSLAGTSVTDAGLVHLSGLTQLAELILVETAVTPDGAAKLEAALPDARIWH